jgi:hypothetical protein
MNNIVNKSVQILWGVLSIVVSNKTVDNGDDEATATATATVLLE